MLIKKLWNFRKERKKYRIIPKFYFEWDRQNYGFSFLPTIIWYPWICRTEGCIGILDFWWLNFHICFGKWVRLSCRNCTKQDKCIKAKRINWYFDNIFNTKNCRGFRPK